jgi:ABC-type transport system involved in cytochrome c biogenesis permease subunit
MTMKRIIPILAMAVALLIVARTAFDTGPDSEFDLAGFGDLPVLADGRIKPLDTVARTTLLILQERQAVYLEDGSQISPNEWLLDTLFRPELADTYRTFKVQNLEALALIGQTDDTLKRSYDNVVPRFMAVLGFLPSRHSRFSFEQIEPYLAEIDRQGELAAALEAPQRDPFQRAVLKLRNRLVIYQQLKHSFAPPEDTDFLRRLQSLQDNFDEGIAAVRARSQGEEHNAELATQMIDTGQLFMVMDQMASLLPLPPLGEDTSDHNWQKTGRALLESFQSGLVNPYALAYAGLGRSWRDQTPETFNTIVELYTNQLETKFDEQMDKARTEQTFNQAAPFYVSALLFVFVFFLATASWLFWPEALQRSAFWVLNLAFVLTSAGIITRMWLEGRPPVTNLYSSALFVGWGCVLLCVVLEKLYPNGIGATAGGMTGFATMVIAHQLSLSGDTLEMMRAVLDSNFWLATHVIVITIGYSAVFLAGFLAFIYVFRGVFTKSLDRETAKSLERMVYGTICFATLFSLVGTILGGIWADQSWGRFWGWDPKENGALLIVIWNAIILHARWGGLARTRGIMALAIFGNIVTSWSWFGTNMLGVGLHSYGFMDEAFNALVAFVVANLLIIALAYFPAGKWRSAPALGRV